jgi:hypothetical protein
MEQGREETAERFRVTGIQEVAVRARKGQKPEPRPLADVKAEPAAESVLGRPLAKRLKGRNAMASLD